jgi:hypothetical protein
MFESTLLPRRVYCEPILRMGPKAAQRSPGWVVNGMTTAGYSEPCPRCHPIKNHGVRLGFEGPPRFLDWAVSINSTTPRDKPINLIVRGSRRCKVRHQRWHLKFRPSLPPGLATC